MNPKEAYQEEFDRIKHKRTTDAFDVFADDIWFAIGPASEKAFADAYREGDWTEMGRIMAAGIDNSVHRLVKWDRIAELSGQTDEGKLDAIAKDNQQRKEDLRAEHRLAEFGRG